MVHQHFKLIRRVHGARTTSSSARRTRSCGFLQEEEAARKKVQELSERYGLKVDLDAKVENITVGMQQRVEILKMLYRDNEILIFDEPTAVLTPQEIEELMHIMRGLTKEGKSILFISHKLNEIMEVSDRVTVLRKGKYIGTVNTSETDEGRALPHDGRPPGAARGGQDARQARASRCWRLKTSPCRRSCTKTMP